MFWLTFELQVEETPLSPPPYIAISPRKCSIASQKQEAYNAKGAVMHLKRLAKIFILIFFDARSIYQMTPAMSRRSTDVMKERINELSCYLDPEKAARLTYLKSKQRSRRD